ncbi:hypothetical protein ADUPG1_006643, partial [Aduncisulcus paluster]
MDKRFKNKKRRYSTKKQDLDSDDDVEAFFEPDKRSIVSLADMKLLQSFADTTPPPPSIPPPPSAPPPPVIPPPPPQSVPIPSDMKSKITSDLRPLFETRISGIRIHTESVHIPFRKMQAAVRRLQPESPMISSDQSTKKKYKDLGKDVSGSVYGMMSVTEACVQSLILGLTSGLSNSIYGYGDELVNYGYINPFELDKLNLFHSYDKESSSISSPKIKIPSKSRELGNGINIDLDFTSPSSSFSSPSSLSSLPRFCFFDPSSPPIPSMLSAPSPTLGLYDTSHPRSSSGSFFSHPLPPSVESLPIRYSYPWVRLCVYDFVCGGDELRKAGQRRRGDKSLDETDITLKSKHSSSVSSSVTSVSPAPSRSESNNLTLHCVG